MATDAYAAAYEGHFLAADDLGWNEDGSGKRFTLEVTAVSAPGTEKDAAGKKIKEALLSFKGSEKRLAVNKTNYRLGKIATGKPLKDWAGCKITIAAMFIDAFGERDVPCIRIIPPDGAPIPKGLRKWLGSPAPKQNWKGAEQ